MHKQTHRYPADFDHNEGESKATANLIYAHNHMLFLLFKKRACICEQQAAYEELCQALFITLREYHDLRETCKYYGIKVAE